jgi:hypothetical protein
VYVACKWGPKTRVEPCDFFNLFLSSRSFGHACALTTAGAVVCWGASTLVLPNYDYIQIKASERGVCGLTNVGTIYCVSGQGVTITGTPAIAGFINVQASPMGPELTNICAQHANASIGTVCWGSSAKIPTLGFQVGSLAPQFSPNLQLVHMLVTVNPTSHVM